MYKFDEKPQTTFSPETNIVIDQIKKSEVAVLVGKNNCGKSYLLKTLTMQFKGSASYLGPARYQNFQFLGHYTPNRSDKKEERWRQFYNQYQNEHQNIDNSSLNLQQAIAELNDNQREVLFEIVEKLLDTKLEILHTVPENEMSQKYISCVNHSISYTSSGFRLITTLITSLLDNDYDTFFIDEPELGISPEAQGALSDFIFNADNRKKYFPHIKHLILATHSTIFLDRQNIKNNYSMAKNGNEIQIKSTKTISDFNNIHFFLLGNRLEHLYLPSCIILTEGKTDHEYLKKILHFKFPTAQLSIISANCDSRMKEIMNITATLLTDLQKSPYRSRIVAILDSKHGSDIVDSLKKAGIPEDHIIRWSKNGIEFLYPEKIVNEIFGGSGEIEIKDDQVSRNGIVYKKVRLCEMVLSKLDEKTVLPEEINKKLFSVVEKIVTF